MAAAAKKLRLVTLEAENERLAATIQAITLDSLLLTEENEALRTAIRAYLDNDSDANWEALAALVPD